MGERTFKLIVSGATAAIVVAIVSIRFCGTLSVPAKPPPPTFSMAKAENVLIATSATPEAWEAYVEKDANTAGVAVPGMDDMRALFPHRLDEGSRKLAPGDPPLDVAGLRLSVELDGSPKSLVLVIENLGETDLAYQIVTRPTGNPAACHSREIFRYDANVVGTRRRERRSECTNRDGLELRIERVETMELNPLSAWYVSRLPAGVLTTDARLTKGHAPLNQAPLCNVVMSQGVRSGLASGQIEWRDLVDFYARHRCDTYHFPMGYKAFRKSGERPLPAVEVPR